MILINKEIKLAYSPTKSALKSALEMVLSKRYTSEKNQEVEGSDEKITLLDSYMNDYDNYNMRNPNHLKDFIETIIHDNCYEDIEDALVELKKDWIRIKIVECNNTEVLFLMNRHNLNTEYVSSLKELLKYMDAIEKSEYVEGVVFGRCKALTEKTRLELIDLFHESYFGTSIDKDVFASELVTVVGGLVSGKLPLKLNHLNVEEIYEEMTDILMSDVSSGSFLSKVGV